MDEVFTAHSHTPKSQGLFLLELFDITKPKRTIEIGMAFGISSLFILEEYEEYNNREKSHIIIDPNNRNNVAKYYFEKEGWPGARCCKIY